MRYLILVGFFVAVSACGPSPMFPGSYSGKGSVIVTCGDPSIDTAGSSTVTWTLTQSGTSLSISAQNGTCNPLSATVGEQTSDAAEFSPRTCPAIPDQFGGTETLSLLDGSLVLDDGGSLSFFARTLSLFVDPGLANATCPGAVFGTLARQK